MDRDAVASHVPRLRRYARALVGDRYQADDLVQDTLERALNKLHLWRPGSDMRAWLFAIMHNVFVNEIRSRRLDADALSDDESIAAPAGSVDRLEIRDLQAALGELPAEQRAVVLLVGLEEMSYAEAAKALGVPIGTVMSRLARGRERLRHLMAGAPAASGLKVVK
ncbi:MAG: sigma-70 family RNA polymerase sigma factor [Burkholderiales bacterium]|jgi:RNA polymerase sigma-70 factor (ECF subfamily)|nr:sigma-70 family RNA polymerase sigma factor [Burkholderiales bacterium]